MATARPMLYRILYPTSRTAVLSMMFYLLYSVKVPTGRYRVDYPVNYVSAPVQYCLSFRHDSSMRVSKFSPKMCAATLQ